MSLTLEDVMDLPLQRIEWFSRRLGEQREEEHRAAKAAAETAAASRKKK